MSDDHPASRYSVGGSENEYMDEHRTVLKNRKGITDRLTLFVEEEKSLARGYEVLLHEVRSDTPMTSELIRYAHGVVFGDLYGFVCELSVAARPRRDGRRGILSAIIGKPISA